MVKHRGDDICGVLLLDKSTGKSSNFYLQRIKYLFNAKKAGHTGSLDPLATGLLPICFGKATCISEYFLHSEKSYQAVIQFGVTTDSHDCDGEVVSRTDVNFTQQQFENALQSFVGEIEQVPPMVSALKHKGQPLYKLALQGKEVERKARKMTVYSLSGELLDNNQARLNVHCSSGFYIRQLAADLGEKLACGAHVIELRRTTSKYLDVTNAISFEELESKFEELNDSIQTNSFDQKAAYIQSVLLAPDQLLKSLPKVEVNKTVATDISHGRKGEFDLSQIQEVTSPDQHFRVYQKFDSDEPNKKHFLGIAEITSENQLKIRRLFNSAL